ncbi:type VII secretion protein EssA [Halobacillus shinanisalinarum]|uniref:Type VII secretion protein EssA n=1 Tax=Halobacillus shinanisalinarum TaxID=2932258 RepID=A0ABY4H364_9BACI|nr:type VII secretion protein EssA [Halobacillus shinanisalinarum]UOQ94559.1 type VII secretion protein EssA [Halobacillus shinanisalinarum]
MTFKKLNIYLIISMAVLLFPAVTKADEGELNIEPHYYEENRIILEIDRHSDGQSQQIESLPEELKSLTFDSGQRETYKDISTILFTSSNTEEDSITSKAKKMSLFASEGGNNRAITQEQEGDPTEGSLMLPLLLGIIVMALVLIMFFVLLPKMKENAK